MAAAGAEATDARFDAIVLAGQRAGPDPLARAHGHTWKCLVPAGGVPMIVRVVDALAASARVRSLLVSIDEPLALDRLEPIAALRRRGRLIPVRSEATPSRSVLAAIRRHAPAYPVLITTADHALLTPAIVDWFCERALSAEADIVVALTPADLLLQAFPGAQRTFLRFGAERYTGSNLFALNSARGLRAVEFWRRVEAARKRPWRLARAFGAGPLIRYLLGRLELEDALALASARLGAHAAAVVSPFAEAGVDVDKPEDLALVERVLDRH